MDLFTLAAKLKLDSSSFETGIKKSEKIFSKFGKSVGSGLKKVAKVGTVAFAAVGAASLAFAKSAVKTGSEFDSAMSQVAATMGLTSTKIKKNLNGAGDSFKMLAAKAREMGAQTIYSATEAAQGLNILAQSGMTAKESVGMIGDVLHLAAAGNIDMASSASYLSQAMKGFKEKGKTSTTYADLIAKGATLASTSVQQLGEALGSAAATGRSYGQSSKSVTLALLRLADQGVRGSAASTALNAAMKDVYKTSGQGAKTLKQLGVSAYNSKGKARDFNAVINDINKATSKMSSKKRTEALQKIFGIQGFKAYNKMAATSTKKQKQWSKELGKSAGEAEKQYKTMTDNLQGDVSAFNSAVSEAKITLSEKMMPTIRKFVQEGTGWVDKLTKAFQKDGLSGALSVASEFISSITERLVKNTPEILAAGWEIMKALGKGIWNGIKAIKWPSWDDVKSFAIKAWDEIKIGVSELGGLIFGKKEDGSVNWPDWETVKAKAEAAWQAIKDEALKLGGLVFGNKEDGSVNWPDLTKLSTDFKKWWDETAAPALTGAISWVLPLFGVPTETAEQISKTLVDWWGSLKIGADLLQWFIGLPSTPDPNTAGKELRGVLSGWWENVKTIIGDVLTLVFGAPSPGDTNGTETQGLITQWWDNIVKPLLSGALNFTLGLFGLPSVTDMVKSVEDWWNGDNGVVSKVKKALTVVIPADVGNKLIEESLSSTLSLIDKKAETAEKLLETLKSMGDVSKESAEKQEAWRTTANELLSLFPSLTGVIDTDTLTIKGNTDEIKENIAQLSNLARERAIQSAKEKQIENMTQANSELIAKQVELDQKRKELIAAKEAAIDNLNTVLQKYGFEANATSDNVDDLYKSMIPIISSSDDYDELATAFAGVSSGVGVLTVDITLLEAEIAANQQQLEKAQADYSAWESSINSLFNTVKSDANAAGTSIENMGAKINNLPSEKTISINVKYNTPTTPNYGNRLAVPKAKGDWNVPYDNFPALLHRNEMVLTSSQARQYREGQSSSMNFAALASAITRAVKDGMANANVNAFIDGQRVTDNVSRRIANEFKSMRYAT